MNLSIDEFVEIFAPKLQQWVLGIITYRAQNRVCVKYDDHFTHVIGKQYEWISIDRIAKKYTHYKAHNAIYNPVKENLSTESRPLCCTSSDNRNDFVILSENRSRGLFVHHINHNEGYRVICKYRQSFINIPTHFMAYASDTDTLYLMNKRVSSSAPSRIILLSASMPLSNCANCKYLEWKRHNYQLPKFDSVAFDDLVGANFVFLPSPINEFHFIKQENDHLYHFKCDPDTNYFVLIDKIDICMKNDDIYEYKLIYVKSMKRMMLFGCNHIYCCRIDDAKQTEYKWRIFSIKLQSINRRNDYHLLLWDHFVFLYFKDSPYDIYCMDLYDEKLFKCSDFSPIAYLNIHRIAGELDRHYINEPYLVASNDGTAHFIGENHYKWSLNEMIPKEFKEKDHAKVMRFVANVQNTNQLYANVPLCISKLILFFYTLFTHVALIRGQLGRDRDI